MRGLCNPKLMKAPLSLNYEAHKYRLSTMTHAQAESDEEFQAGRHHRVNRRGLAGRRVHGRTSGASHPSRSVDADMDTPSQVGRAVHSALQALSALQSVRLSTCQLQTRSLYRCPDPRRMGRLDSVKAGTPGPLSRTWRYGFAPNGAHPRYAPHPARLSPRRLKSVATAKLACNASSDHDSKRAWS